MTKLRKNPGEVAKAKREKASSLKFAILWASLLLPSFVSAQVPDSQPPPSTSKMGFSYPPEALTSCAEGRAIADVLIGADGVPKEVRIVQSSGNDALDAATKEAWLRKSHWQPATQDGKPVDSWKRMAINWSLDGAKCIPGQGVSKGPTESASQASSPSKQ